MRAICAQMSFSNQSLAATFNVKSGGSSASRITSETCVGVFDRATGRLTALDIAELSVMSTS